MNDTSTELLKAQSPAALAEEYLIKSIWNQLFPAGSELPAERELAEKIGVTRTTLREVLQRLARDGWLTIQHGKATKVNDIWQTAGPNIIGTLIQLNPNIQPTIIDNVVSLRTRMAEYYIPLAIQRQAAAAAALFADLEQLSDNAEAYAAFDYQLFRQLTFIADKPVYGLILNSFNELYHQVARLFFSYPQARIDALRFYQELANCCANQDHKKAADCMQIHRQQSAQLWGEILKTLQN